MSPYYSPSSHQRRALHAIFAVVFLAAVPATLGGLSQALSATASAGQGTVETATQLGNQPPGTALGEGAVAVLGAQGEALAFCSGDTGANTVAHLNCPPGLRQFSVE